MDGRKGTLKSAGFQRNREGVGRPCRNLRRVCMVDGPKRMEFQNDNGWSILLWEWSMSA